MRLTVLALAVLLGVVAAGCGSSSAPKTARAAIHLTRYRDSTGWTLSYPQALHLEHSSRNFFHDGVDEVTVATFPMSSPIHTSVSRMGASMRVLPPRDSHGTFPRNGVALRVYRDEGGDWAWFLQPESRFPLRLSSFHRSTYGAAPEVEQRIVADAGQYTIQAWIGPRASATERAILARIVRSIAFPRLHAGQSLYNLGVFARAGRYPVGSFTRIRPGSDPAYLVHAPGGWYAVAWKWPPHTGYASRCRVQFDRATTQFFCSNMRARWDRLGRVIVKPRSARQGDPLDLNEVGISWDGHVLVDPGTSRRQSPSYAHQLWPSVYP
jgi:hypothetical protein